MKTNLRTFTFCVKIQGWEEPGSYLQIFVGLYWTRLETRRQIAKKNETKKKERKTEKRKKLNYKEGRGKKPKIQACLNSQEIRKVNKVKKTNQNKQKQVKKVIRLIMKAR